jgi:hypothetical protein
MKVGFRLSRLIVRLARGASRDGKQFAQLVYPI